MSSPTVAAASRYLDRVRAALTDVPDEERDELVADLADHLAEIGGETGGVLDDATLVTRLGPPEEYAAELRSAAGLTPVVTEPPGHVGRLRQAARAGWDAVGQLPGVPAVRGFLPELRPGWWVVRGYCVAVILTALFGAGFSFSGLLPYNGNDLALFVLMTVLAACASVWLGRRTDRLGRRRRRVIGAGGILVALIAAFVLLQSHDSAPMADYAYAAGPLERATDLRVYDRDGNLLRDAQVFDQDGNPIDVTDGCPYQPRTRTDGSSATNVYPRVPDPGNAADGYYCVPADRQPVPERLPALVPTPSTGPSAGPTPTVPTPTVPTPSASGPATPGPSTSGSVPSGPSTSATPTSAPR